MSFINGTWVSEHGPGRIRREGSRENANAQRSLDTGPPKILLDGLLKKCNIVLDQVRECEELLLAKRDMFRLARLEGLLQLFPYL